jgi:hypothetical protein
MGVNKAILLVFLVIAVNAIVCVEAVFAQDWPEVFDPNLLLTLNIEMNPADWNEVVDDETFDIEKPAWFWTDGEESQKLFVSVRRKSADPIPPAWGEGGVKIGLKIDINEYIDQDWHGLIKLSLENGDDNNVLTEGIACNLHQMASGPEGYGYDSWRANWVKVYVNGHCYGVYVNAEQLDKRFLQNRGLYVWHETWLYQYRGEHNFTLETGDDENPRSPAVGELCCFPFAHGNSNSPLYPEGGICSPPDDANLVIQLNDLINMQGMLTMAAVNAFVANPDSLFSHERNSHFLDFNTVNPAETRKRMYLPWDVDAAMQSTSFDIYGGASPTEYQQLILGNSVFRAQYDQIICDLLSGPLSKANILAFIDMIEPVLTDAVAADPYNQLETPGVAGVAEEFDQIRNWFSDRITNVGAQLVPGGGDTDSDGMVDCLDNCPNDYNPSQTDSDADGIGNACDQDCPNLDSLNPVGFVDFSILASDWRSVGPGLPGDLDMNEQVDPNDLAIFVDYWLSECYED